MKPISALAQHVYPQRALSKLMLQATRAKFAPWKNWQIRWFVDRYNVDLAEVVESDLTAYQHFNAFFTRALVNTARPQPTSPAELSSPADGVLSQMGDIAAGRIIQAKGQCLSVKELLACGNRHSEFDAGKFLTIYLSPRDYHRVHMPYDGKLIEMRHVPGRLFSVNPVSAQSIRGLFARNERVVSIFNTPRGRMAVILVGALFVGSIEQIWCGAVTTNMQCGPDSNVVLSRGDEMGRFNMGSTVIVLLENSTWNWKDLHPGMPLQVGRAIAHI